ncbi:Inactive hydroxysteroid dehydrogenase-like protein 1 [Halotydeus destructor]|nr:Inactive hydroxysteroid dehydrogenase-like protein 1 [Halotydeus destructor]
MSIEKVNEVPFTLRRTQRSRISRYWAIMGFLFEIARDIHPHLKIVIDTMTLFGIIYSVRTGFTLFRLLVSGLRTHIWARIWSLNLKKLYGDWVVITGATDGIGKEYALEFARRGHSLVLVGRSEEKLATTKQELGRILNPTQIVTVVCDLNTADSETFQQVAREINGDNRNIGILVNNAGVMFESPNKFLDQPEDSLWQHVKVNMAGVLMITRAVLPGMVSRRRGLVINLSSIAGYRPLPLMGVYSASKKFVEYFSDSLEYEYSSYNIQVQTLTPSYIATKMTKWSNMLQQPGLVTPDARSFAKSAVATIGRSNHTTGYWAHGLQWFMYEWFTPDWLWSLSSWHLLRNIDSTKKAK